MKDARKATKVNDTKQLIKMAVEPKKNNRIMGIHILASIAADMAHEAATVVKYRLTVDDVIETVMWFQLRVRQ